MDARSIPPIAALALLAVCGAAEAQDASSAPSDPVPLYEGLGDHRHPVTTGVTEAQAYFDQGLRLVYAFNHAEAVRSFRAAQRLDPGCAMCWWGEALALGPNINADMDSVAAEAAHRAVREAERRAAGATPFERAFIEALAKRYASPPPAERAQLDSAYARAMGEVARAHPEDDDAQVLFAEALMLLSPWDYWTEADRPRTHMVAALDALERVMERNPEHAGACHLYVHAVEAAHPRRALGCAERLPALMPAAGHIVHMPAHVYIRVGRYNDAIETNIHAAHADERMIPDMAPDGVYRLAYVPHNHHFLWFAASMAGRGADAIRAARETAALVDRSLLEEPGLAALQHYLATPLFALVRFGRWQEILREPRPSALPYPTGIWHYARALAFTGTGQLAAAEREYEALERVRRTRGLEQTMIWGINSASAILEVASEVVAGEIAAERGDYERAIRHLRRGAALEDRLLYDEPPTWHLPVRHRLGTVLLEAGRAAEAERVYREDLERFPENGWSLIGLARALRAQDRVGEAADVEARFRQAWARADTPVEASRL